MKFEATSTVFTFIGNPSKTLYSVHIDYNLYICVINNITDFIIGTYFYIITYFVYLSSFRPGSTYLYVLVNSFETVLLFFWLRGALGFLPMVGHLNILVKT